MTDPTGKQKAASQLPSTAPRSCPASPNATATAAAGISPEPPAAHGPLPGNDETARLPSLVSRLSPLAASKHPRGRSQPHRYGAFPNLPVHRRVLPEGREPHARCPSLWRVPRQPNLRAFRPFRRALLSARGGLFIPFLDPIPPNEGGARKPLGSVRLDHASIEGRRRCSQTRGAFGTIC